MKAIVLNNQNALILDILGYEKEESGLINLQLTVNPVIRISTDSTKTFIVDTDDLDNQKEVAYVFAESLVGSEGIITNYSPRTKKHEMKLTKKIIKNKTD